MKKSLLIFISIILPLSLFILGCENKQKTKKNNKQLTVYTTVYPLQYFTERIGGDFVKVDTIYPPGADEHTFEPTQRDMMNLVDADLFFYVGLGLEGFVDKAKDTLKNEKVEMISTADHISFGDNPPIDQEQDSEQAESTEHNQSIDPHVWLDPIYAQELAKSIRDSLVKKMPEQKDTFDKNYQELSKELEKLNQSFESTAQSAKYKEIVVAHAAYGYWEKRYGIKQISISGLSTTNEPSQKKLEEIVSKAKQDHIKYIIFEQNVTSKLTKIVEDEVGAKSLTLHNLSVLTRENIDNKDNYFTIMDKNIQTLNKALND
ncbi:metal ABC transporter solute-binding protein, Zn/Mn family [Bacillus sp. 1NLA3E]|uniref:metal ABC transporter solute-binding protein, Zn/Mn family n=1 Tax=Bacillus sp. 1NLA3E TaxID=666686 RepID=UPI00030A58A5|nr:zinc ABC transporter substrate-binding protein [Bacillus sp. 1NLA3E]